MPHYRLDVEYEGTRYHGWQEQANARSIVGELKRAIAQAGGDLVDLGGSGRTDAGVHALAQTAHMRLRAPVDAASFRWAINSALPADIHVLSLRAASDTFHARHSAVSRSYLYQICRRRTALSKRHVWWIRDRLDLGRMEAGAALLAGSHDFVQFCERPAEQSSTRVLVESAEIVEAGALVVIRLTASHFLWKMVRRVVGTLARVGTGEMNVAGLRILLEGRPLPGAEEGTARWTAPASGLFLERVLYPGEALTQGPALPVCVPAEPSEGAGLFTGEQHAAAAAPRAPSPRGVKKSPSSHANRGRRGR